MIQAVAALAALLALGGHAIAPWRAAPPTAASAGGRGPSWGLLALPLLLAAAAASALAIGEWPDSIAAATDRAAAGWPTAILKATLILVASTAAGDLLLLIARRRLERTGWWLVGSLGVGLLLAGSFALELLRAGLGPTATVPLLLTAAGCRALLALAAGEAIAPGRPRLAPLAAAALPGFWLCLPAALRELLIEDGMLVTTAAAVLLFAAARWLPERLRRPSLLAAVVLAALFLARAAELTARLPLEPIVSS